jgi:hypothetical protein
MVGTRTKVALGGALLLLAGAAASAQAGGGGAERATLTSFGEVPTLSTTGGGTFQASINTTTDRIRYTLDYSSLTTPVQQAHIHLGRTATVGGISAFLCSNLDGAPAGTPACPRNRGSVSGVITAADVIGPTAQALGVGHFNELVTALRAGAAYVNVHTDRFPSGEIRGQVH